MKGALTEIVQLATLDSDPWVLMVADILKSFPDTGSLNLDLEEQNPNVQDILGELREKGKCLLKMIDMTPLFRNSLSLLRQLRYLSGIGAGTSSMSSLNCHSS